MSKLDVSQRNEEGKVTYLQTTKYVPGFYNRRLLVGAVVKKIE